MYIPMSNGGTKGGAASGTSLTGIVRCDSHILQMHVGLCLVNLGLRDDDGTHP